MSYLVQVSDATWIDINRIKKIHIRDEVLVEIYMDGDTDTCTYVIICNTPESALKFAQNLAARSQGARPPSVA